MFRDAKRDLVVALSVSLLLSVYLFFNMHAIALDGAFQFIPMARIFAAGSWTDAMNYTGQQPLYAFLISLVSRLTGDFDLAARWISSFFGILIILPIYLMAKQVFDRKVAFLSVLFLAAHPYIRRFSADAIKESTYLFFFALTMWITLKALQRGRLDLFFFLPFFSGLTCLVRPDGIEPLLAVFLYIPFARGFGSPEKKIKVLVLLLVSSAILFLPYLLHMKEATGVWTLSKTKSLEQFIGLGPARDGIPIIHKVAYTFVRLFGEIEAGFHPVFLFLILIGFFKRWRSGFRNGEGLLILAWFLHCAILFLLILNLTDWSRGLASPLLFSRRHVLPLLILSIVWAGDGFLILLRWVSDKPIVNRCFHRVDPRRRPAVILATLLVLILGLVLSQTLKPQRYEKLSEKWAGLWIKNQSGKGATIFTTLPRVAYYADGVFEFITPGENQQDKIRTALGEKKRIYLVVQEEEAARFLGASAPDGNAFTEVKRYQGKGIEKVVIYRTGF